jgi:hypothetical protein
MRSYLVLLVILFFTSCGREKIIDSSLIHSFDIGVFRGLDDIVDIDGDNDLDIVTRGEETDANGNNVEKIRFLLNDGSRNFIDSGAEFTPNKTSDGSIGYRDLDQDGLTDIFFVDTGNKIVLLKNQGNLTFTELQRFSTTIGNQELQSFAFNDTDNNGILDLVVVINHQQFNLEVIVFKDLQQNIISDIPIGLIEDRVDGLTVVDLNKDSLLDFVIKEPFHLNIFINKGNFNFEKTDTVGVNGLNVITLSFVTDVDGDNLPDIWVDSEDSNPNENTFEEIFLRTTFIFWNRGNGKFRKDGENLGFFRPFDDINGDGDKDLLDGSIDNRISIKKNIGGRSFLDSFTLVVPFNFFLFFVVDIDSDTIPDWIFTESNGAEKSNKINILFGDDL